MISGLAWGTMLGVRGVHQELSLPRPLGKRALAAAGRSLPNHDLWLLLPTVPNRLQPLSRRGPPCGIRQRPMGIAVPPMMKIVGIATRTTGSAANRRARIVMMEAAAPVVAVADGAERDSRIPASVPLALVPRHRGLQPLPEILSRGASVVAVHAGLRIGVASQIEAPQTAGVMAGHRNSPLNRDVGGVIVAASAVPLASGIPSSCRTLPFPPAKSSANWS